MYLTIFLIFRVLPPTEPFLLIIYSTEHSNRQMFDVQPLDRDISFNFNLLSFNDNLQTNRVRKI